MPCFIFLVSKKVLKTYMNMSVIDQFPAVRQMAQHVALHADRMDVYGRLKSTTRVQLLRCVQLLPGMEKEMSHGKPFPMALTIDQSPRICH